MIDQGEILKRACDLIVKDPTLQPEYDDKAHLLKTHCNQGVRIVAQALGIHDFDDESLMADGMIALMAAGWKKVSGPDAVLHALSGGLAIAALDSKTLGEAHGHVCVVYPSARQRSNSLNADVPLVANVGPGDPASPLVESGRSGIRTRSNWICTVSWAFPCKRLEREPDYFIKEA